MPAISKETAQQKIIVSVVTLLAIALLAVGSHALMTKPEATVATTKPNSNVTSSSTGTYKDGTYKAAGDYASPGGPESVAVSLTLSGGTISDATVEPSAKDGVAQIYQSYFVKGYKQYVVGKKIADVKLSRVAGSSLTSKGFNKALEKIKQQAQS